MTDPPFRIFDDDGNEINPALIVKPSLCVSCKKDSIPSEEVLCQLWGSNPDWSLIGNLSDQLEKEIFDGG